MAICTAFDRLALFLVDISCSHGDYDETCWVMGYGALFCSVNWMTLRMEAVGLLETSANIYQDKLASHSLRQHSSVSCCDCRRRIVIEALECLR